MMKRSLYFILLGVFAAQSIFSQRVTISERLPLESNDRYEILGKTDGKILIFLDKQDAFEIEAFDEKLSFLWNQRINLGDREVRLAGVESAGDHIHFLYYYRSEDDISIRYAQYDADMNLTDSTKIASLEKNMFLPDVYFTTSEDENKAILFYSEQKDDMTAHAIDLVHGEIMWKNNFQFSDEIQSDFRSMILTNQGEMMMVAERNNRRFGRKNHRFDIFYFHEDMREPEIHSIPFSDHLVYESTFVFDNMNGQLVGGGLYAKNSSSRAEGTFLIKMEIPYSAPIKELYPFESQLLEDLTSSKSAGDDHINDITVRDLFLRRDGGALLVCEIERIYERGPSYGESSFFRSYSGSDWVDYYYEDLILTSFQPGGKKHWSSVLHKRQYSQDDQGRYSSYFSFVTPSRLRFVFNDEISKNNTVSEYILWGNGYHERKSVMSTFYQQLRLRFEKAIQLSSTTLLVPSEQRDALQLVRIDLEDWEQ